QPKGSHQEAQAHVIPYFRFTKLIIRYFEDDEYNLERRIQMSLESLQAHGQAPLSGLAIHELFSRITRKLPDVEGKEKGIATDEQVALSLLDLQKTKEQ
ncbi:hypothetical protein Tco_0560039, partial [Tanacetum coccineum]